VLKKRIGKERAISLRDSRWGKFHKNEPRLRKGFTTPEVAVGSKVGKVKKRAARGGWD